MIPSQDKSPHEWFDAMGAARSHCTRFMAHYNTADLAMPTSAVRNRAMAAVVGMHAPMYTMYMTQFSGCSGQSCYCGAIVPISLNSSFDCKPNDMQPWSFVFALSRSCVLQVDAVGAPHWIGANNPQGKVVDWLHTGANGDSILLLASCCQSYLVSIVSHCWPCPAPACRVLIFYPGFTYRMPSPEECQYGSVPFQPHGYNNGIVV